MRQTAHTSKALRLPKGLPSRSLLQMLSCHLSELLSKFFLIGAGSKGNQRTLTLVAHFSYNWTALFLLRCECDREQRRIRIDGGGIYYYITHTLKGEWECKTYVRTQLFEYFVSGKDKSNHSPEFVRKTVLSPLSKQI